MYCNVRRSAYNWQLTVWAYSRGDLRSEGAGMWESVRAAGPVRRSPFGEVRHCPPRLVGERAAARYESQYLHLRLPYLLYVRVGVKVNIWGLQRCGGGEPPPFADIDLRAETLSSGGSVAVSGLRRPQPVSPSATAPSPPPSASSSSATTPDINHKLPIQNIW